MKWHRYNPNPEVNSLGEFITILGNDEHCYFYS